MLALVTVASLVIAVLALVVAVAAALYARQQAVETRHTREIEEDRRRPELAEGVRLHLEEVNDGAWHRLMLDNGTGRALIAADVEIVEGPGCWFTPGTNGVEATTTELPQRARLDVAPLEPGRVYAWRIEFDTHQTTGALRVHATLTSGAGTPLPHTWTKVVDLRAPQAPNALGLVIRPTRKLS